MFIGLSEYTYISVHAVGERERERKSTKIHNFSVFILTNVVLWHLNNLYTSLLST